MSTDRETERKVDVVTVPARGAIRDYVRGQTFLLAKGRGRFRYNREHNEGFGQKENHETSISSHLGLNARFGVGLGRVRVVTPVIWALRVRERLPPDMDPEEAPSLPAPDFFIDESSMQYGVRAYV